MDILETAAYDRRQRRNMSCALLLSLLPFFASSTLYFHLWTPDSPPSVLEAVVKSGPALLLAVVVLRWNGGLSLLGVAGGLVLSAVGDACLVYQELFIHGMGAFAAAHLMYSLTFLFSGQYPGRSWSPWNLLLSLVLFACGGFFYVYIYPFLQRAPNPDVIVPGVGIYIALIVLMGTLAARTGHALSTLGSLVFMVSDITVALRNFQVTPQLQLPHGNTIVMVTYYLAQLLIAVGDVRAAASKDDFAKWKRS